MNKKLIHLLLAIMGASGLYSNALAQTVENPFQNATGYINPDYANEVSGFMQRNPDYQSKAKQLGLLNSSGSLAISTAIWLDSVAAIEGDKTRGTHSVSYYLNDALKQATTNKPVVITFVIYDLPLRDCDAYSSNGEFKSPSDLANYKTQYIDKIKKIFADFYQLPNAQNVRMVLVIEPDSLPNLITNANQGTCQIAATTHVYVDGVSYVLQQFSGIPQSNISMYLDIAHSGWLGWADNMNKVADIYNSTTLGAGFNNIRGFITNTANYTPLQEAFTYDQYLPNYQNPLASQWIMLTKFYSWNEAYDEASFVAEILSLQNNGRLQQADTHRVLPPATQKYAGLHFLVDTSRNGWMVNNADYSALDNQNKIVRYSRRDQRHHRGNWCNIQSVNPENTSYDNPDNKLIPANATSAGLGQFPESNPQLVNPLYKDSQGQNILLPIDAYVWIKPPGESDGYYDSSDNSGDKMCGNSDGGAHDDYQATDSLQDSNAHAPHAGLFFDNALKNLIDVRGCIDGKFTSRFCVK